LTARQWNQLKRIILKGAVAAGFSTERWTLPHIQQVIAERWQVRYTTAWLSIRLRQLGLSVQRPTSVARAKDDELAEAWIRQDWSRIKKVSSRGAAIVSCDEFAVGFRDRLTTTWGATGQTPVLRREDKRRGLSCFCGLTSGGRIYTIYFAGSIDRTRVVESLRHIRRYVKGRLIIIWDRLAAHRSPAVREYLSNDRQIDVEFLPAYSPELNPEEYCHGYAKNRWRNAAPNNVNELLRGIENEFQRIRRRPKLIQSFLAHAGLS
jgi:transposase